MSFYIQNIPTGRPQLILEGVSNTLDFKNVFVNGIKKLLVSTTIKEESTYYKSNFTYILHKAWQSNKGFCVKYNNEISLFDTKEEWETKILELAYEEGDFFLELAIELNLVTNIEI